MPIRIATTIVLFISLLFFPFWVSAVLALAAMLVFDIFWQAPVLFLISDTLYGTGVTTWHTPVFAAFLFSALALLVIELFKKKITYYPTRDTHNSHH